MRVATTFRGFGAARDTATDGGSTASRVFYTALHTTVRPVTNDYWDNGVLRGGAALILDVDPSLVTTDCKVTLPNTSETRSVTKSWGSQAGGAEVFLSGPALTAASGAPAPAVILVPTTTEWPPDNPLGRPWYGPNYVGVSPHDKGILDAVFGGIVHGVEAVGSTIVRAVGDAAHAVGAAVSFIAGHIPTPADYTAENLAVVGWTDPVRFAVLEVAANIIFPGGASILMTPFRPPIPVNLPGLALGVAEAFAAGGTDRVIAKVLDPIYAELQDQAGAVIDFAMNGEPALVRWALKKVAQHLPANSMEQAIVLVLAASSDAVVKVIKDVSALKDQALYEEIGVGLTDIAQKFPDKQIANILNVAGTAIKGGGEAIAAIADKGIAGISDALDTLKTKILGIPADFDTLTDKAKGEIAALKVKITDGQSPASLFAGFVTNVRQGMDDFAKAASKLPGDLGKALGGIVGVLDKLLGKVDDFIKGLIALANAWMNGAFPSAPPPAPAPTPAPSPAPTPTPIPVPAPSSSMNLTKILLMAGGGAAGFLLGGPLGAAVGAGAGALLPFGSSTAKVLPVTNSDWNNGVQRGGAGLVLGVALGSVKAGDQVILPGNDVRTVTQAWGSQAGLGGMEVFLSGVALSPTVHGAPAQVQIKRG